MIEKNETMLEIVKYKLLSDRNVELSIRNMMSKAIEYTSKILDFKEPDPENMLEVEESEELATDARLFQAYNAGVDDRGILGSVIWDATNPYEDVIKFEYKSKEIVIAFSAHEEYSKEYTEEFLDVTIHMNVSTKKRLHFDVQSVNNFDIEYEKKLDKYDDENDKRYIEYLSDRIIEWKAKETLNLDKYILSDSDKEFLQELYNCYENPFILALKDGILFIHSDFYITKEPEEDFVIICYFIQQIMQIIERFINI